MRLSKISLLFLAVLTIFSCRKDNSSEPTLTPTIGPFEVVNSYTVDIQGFVKNPDGFPIENALIKVGDQEVLTSEAGTFYIEKMIAPETGLYLLADADRHFKGGSTVYSHSNNLYTVNITLVPYDQVMSFDAATGIDEVNDDGARLKIQANGIIDNNGSPYTGTVEAHLFWIDPSSEEVTTLSPGPLVGLQDDEMRSLRSFGMIGVEMIGEAGQALNLAEGVNADLSFPVPPVMISDAPTEIDLWHFNENTGLWEIEGSAMLINGSYEASVPHFSWWNCDVPSEIAQICFRLVDENGRAIGNLDLVISSGIFGTASAWVDGSGVYCDIVPLNTELVLSLYTFCGDEIVSEAIGPLTTNEEIVITVPLASNNNQSLNVSGMVTCGTTDIVTNGFVVLSIGSQTFLDYVDDQGNYSIDFITCADLFYQASLTAFDLDGLTNGAVVVDVDTEDVEQNIDGCNAELGEEALIIVVGSTTAVYSQCEANITNAEITIIAKDLPNTNYIILGVDGFGQGIYGANIFGTLVDNNNDIPDEQGVIEVNITSYSDVPGEKIAGTFNFQDINGSFIAIVQ